MNLCVVAIGEKMPNWIETGVNEYAKRFPRGTQLRVIELRAASRGGGKSVAAALATEAQRLRAAIPNGAWIVALDQRGEQWTSERLAAALAKWLASGRDVAFLVGGADGLHEDIKVSAHQLLALSTFTLPHAVARLVIAEQLYRAVSILKSHPYHRV